MNVYFIIILILDTLGLGMHLAKDGEPKEGEYNFFVSLISVILNIFLIVMAIKKGF